MREISRETTFAKLTGRRGGGQSNTQSGDTQCNLMTFKSDLRPQMLRTSVTTSKQKEHRIYKRSTQNKISKKYICENLPTISSLASVGSGINLCLMPRNPRESIILRIDRVF